MMTFLIFGILGTASSNAEPDTMQWAAGALLSLMVAGATLGLNFALLSAVNPEVRKKHGGSGIVSSVLDGHLYMIPFLFLAVIATVVLKWQAAMSFASAAVMIGGATAGTETMKKGARGIKNMLIPSGIAFISVFVWMAALSIISKI